MGRVFDENDDRVDGGHPLVVLSHAYWTSRFGADPGMLNRTMIVNGRALTVVGVAQKGFSGEMPGIPPDLFIPISMKKEMTPDWDALKDRKDYWVTLFGRLKPGSTLEQAQTAINITYQPQLQQDIALLSKVSDDTLKKYQAKKIVLRPGDYGRGSLREQGRKPLQLLLAMTFLVLLIACANVANLQLTRALARTRETAVRLALGASRAQLVGQLLMESGLVALAGAVLGLAVAYWTQLGILAALPPRTLGAGVLTAGARRPDARVRPGPRGRHQPRSSVSIRRSRRRRPQLTLGPSRSERPDHGEPRHRSVSQGPGRPADGDFTAAAHFSGALRQDPPEPDEGRSRRPHRSSADVQPDAEVERLLDERDGTALSRSAGAPRGAARCDQRHHRARGGDCRQQLQRQHDGGRLHSERETATTIRRFNEVGPDYFRTLGIPLIAGREFTETDRAGRAQGRGRQRGVRAALHRATVARSARRSCAAATPKSSTTRSLSESSRTHDVARR